MFRVGAVGPQVCKCFGSSEFQAWVVLCFGKFEHRDVSFPRFMGVEKKALGA